jgi:D-glycero-D-manno-heptose 1,7-bisphosphate phosphatase
VRRACFLDRDGVIVQLLPDGKHSVRTPDQVRLCDGAALAITRLRQAGLLAIVVTNQPGPAKGEYTRDSIAGATTRMHELLAAAGTRVDDVYICLHHPDGGPGGDLALVQRCACRKPQPGMLLEAARKHDIDLAASFMIGDNHTDVQAGEAAGCRSLLVGDRLPTLAHAVDVVLNWLLDDANVS